MEIKKVEPFREPGLVMEIASVYQRTFGAKPWEEGYQCPVCEKILPLKCTGRTCPACLENGDKILLAEYWPAGRVISDFYREMKKPESLCLAALEPGGDTEKVVGFAWGYKIRVAPEIDAYLDAPGLNGLIAGDFFYLDEAAVLPEYQGRGLGQKIISQLFSSQPQKKILLRTLRCSLMYYIIGRWGGRVIIGISRERVIMALDLENPVQMSCRDL